MSARTLRAAWVEVNLNNIKYNFNSVRNKVWAKDKNIDIIPIIKADAYGHGAIKAAHLLIEEDAKSFGVATLAEAIEIRESGIEVPIVILGLTPKKYANEIIKHNFISVVSTLDDAKILNDIGAEFGNKAEVFVALETGMGRVGFTEEMMADILKISELPFVNIRGTFSHFACADAADETHARGQIAKFDIFNDKLSDAGLNIKYKTMANSAALMNFSESYYDAVRPGIVLYGCYPSKEVDKSRLDIRPVMSVKANIVLLRKLPVGSTVSYGSKFVCERESLIGTLPLGYADGLPRMLSGSGRVIVNGHYAPIVGRICMDQCMIDVTDVPDVKEYDEVIIMGSYGEKEITADEIGDKSDTINYEVTCRFGQRLPKVYL